ncbi:MAG TPA: hypothetical protein DCP92_05605 [Nitrospiraceae bacterium]|nr:hypothetical protein [Nitrospiraceae bacterium]
MDLDISYITMNRMCEKRLRKDAAFRKKVPSDRLNISLSAGRRMSDEELLFKLGSFGLEIDRQTLGEWRKGFLSAEAMAKWIIAKRNISAEGLEIDWVWICLTVLWERWFPETPSLEMIDDMMQNGYERLESRDSVEACDIWLKVWGLLLDLADRKMATTIDDLDRIFRGTQSIFNWVQDLETELCNATMGKKDLMADRISLCEKLLVRFPHEDSLLLENTRRALADSYFESGNKEKADLLFREWLKDDPRGAGAGSVGPTVIGLCG